MDGWMGALHCPAVLGQLGCPQPPLPPTALLLTTAYPSNPPLHLPAGAEAAFVATLSANAGLVAVLRACLTPAQLAYGATLPTPTPAAQVSTAGSMG